LFISHLSEFTLCLRIINNPTIETAKIVTIGESGVRVGLGVGFVVGGGVGEVVTIVVGTVVGNVVGSKFITEI